MQCPECHYTTFKALKKCTNCDFDFKGYKTAYRDRAQTFSIHEGAPMVVAAGATVDYDVEGAQTTSFEDRALLPEALHLTPSGDFSLDLSDVSLPVPVAATSPQEFSTEETLPLESLDNLDFDLDADLDMGDLEVEGLGFEDIDESPKKVSGAESNEISLKSEATAEPETEINLVGSEISLEPDISLDLEPGTATELSLDLGLDTEEVVLEPAVETDSDEITLDFEDDTFAPHETPVVPQVASPPEEDEFEIKLELEDDSDAPLSGESQPEPVVEIEDLGLELEDSEENKPPPGKD